MNLLTFKGYGHLAPESPTGRIFCILYALIGIPLNGIIFATLADFFASKVSNMYRQFEENESSSSNHISTYNAVVLKLINTPSGKRSMRRLSGLKLLVADLLLYFVPGSIVFLAVPAVLFSYVEKWDYLDSFYYAFISLTTIGFGDLVAGRCILLYMRLIRRPSA